jgi:uncharacterized protein (TIGR03067 family)
MTAYALTLALGLLGADQTTIEGTYTTIAGQENGRFLAEDHVKDTSVVITADDITVYNAKTAEMEVFSYRLTADNKNQGIDMTVMLGKDEGKVAHGLFEKNGDRLRITFFPAGVSQRPTTFDTKGGGGQMTFEMLRVSP